MKHIYIAILCVLFYNLGTAKEKSNLPPPTASISGNATICQNATGSVVTFTGSGGMAPYTFTYTINGNAQPTITTATGNTVTLPVVTAVTGTFTYSLVSVKDSTNATQPQTGSVMVTVASPPAVDFIFTNDNTCSGTNVQFTASVSGSGSNVYSWNFGDGSPLSAAQNPSHTFVALGCGTVNFTVTLTVTVNGCTVTRTHTIIVKQKPDINFTDAINPFDPFSNCLNAAANPVYSITVGNASASACVASFTINWGDGNTDNNVTFPANHTYNLIGAYSMVITANGSNGCSNSITYIIKNVSNPLGGLNSPGSTQNLCAPTTNLQFSISNWGTNSPDTIYTIDYDDGTPILTLTQSQLVGSTYYNAASPATSANYPTPHIYTTSNCPAPSFEVKLNVTNACGTTPFTLGNISILTKPTADFTSPPNGCVGTNVLFTNTTISGYGQSCVESAIYTWDFGDGSPVITTPLSPPQNINHTYAAIGNYTITLTSQNFCGLSSKTHSICIEPPLVPQFSLSLNSGCIPLAITASDNTNLTNQCSPPTYNWQVTYTSGNCGTAPAYTFTGGTSASSQNPTFNFTAPGSYLIQVDITNSCGVVSSNTQTVVVKKPPTVTIDPIANACGNASINPTAIIDSCAPASSLLSYLWSFPGGTPVNPALSTTSNPGIINYTTNGNYTVSLVVTNECGNSVTATQTFSVNTAPLITNTNLSQTICSGTQTTAVNLTANPTGTTFTWTATATSGISGFIVSDNTPIIPVQTITTTNTAPGTVTYTIIPTIGGCNGATVSYVINVNPAPAITTQPISSEVCLGGNPTALTVSNIPGANYQWHSNPGNILVGTNNPSYAPLATTVGTTTYYCELIFATGGCPSINSNSATVIVNAMPSIDVQPQVTQTACIGGAITSLTVHAIGGAGTVTYQWYTSPADSPVGTDSPTYTPPTNVAVGTYRYYCTITFTGNGCGFVRSNTVDVIIVNGPIINTQPLATQTNCLNEIADTLEVIMTPGNYNYQWYRVSTPTDILVGTNASTYIPPTNLVGTERYYCQITQVGLGCSINSAFSDVIVSPSPSVNPIQPAYSICLGDPAPQFTASYSNGVGTPVYQWYMSPGNIPVGTNAPNFTPPASTIGTAIYFCEISFPAISGNCSVIGTNLISFTVNANPVIALATATICSSRSFDIQPIALASNLVPPGTTYTWSAPIVNPTGSITGASIESNPQISISQTLTNLTTSPATVAYTVTPTAGSNCVGADFTVIITVNPAINPNVVATNNSCFGVNNASITTNITGGIPFSTNPPYQITWVGPTGSLPTATSISNLAPGVYTLDVVDAGGCPFHDTYTITEPTAIVLSLNSKADMPCFESSNIGSIDINVIGGTGAYVYSWTKDGNPFAATEDLQNLSEGNYVVTVTDANNCGPRTDSFTIIRPTVLAVNLISQTNVICFGDATGAINVNVTGGTPNYIFSWSGPNGYSNNTQNLNAIFAGVYNLTVTDVNGCFKNLTVTITESTEIIIAATTTPITCYGANNASLAVTLSGGNPPYQFQWDNLSTSLTQTNLSAGDYIITVTDNLGCVRIKTINIPQAPVFMANPIVSNISCFGANNGSINLNLTGGIAPVALFWSDGSTSGLIRNNLGPGTYSATISDGTPCYIVNTFTIVEPQALVLSANITNALDCNNTASGDIDLVVAGGVPPYSYLWSNNEITEDLSSLTSGNYSVIVTDANGCSKTGQYAVIRQNPIAITVVTQTDFDCTTHTIDQNFVAQVSGGIPPYQLQWSSGNVSGVDNEIMHSDTNGTILLNVTDSNSCTATYPVIVDNPVIGYADFEPASIGHTAYGIYSIGDPIQFNSTINGDYVSVSWDFGDGTFSTEINPLHTYVNPRDYVVTQTVTYPFGCFYVRTITLIIENGYVIRVPTAFTPNSDSLNDTFRPVTKRLSNIRLDVYDTWGSLIFSESGEVLVGWDGKIKGINAENGNYYSKVSAQTFYGTTVNVNQPFVLIK